MSAQHGQVHFGWLEKSLYVLCASGATFFACIALRQAFMVGFDIVVGLVLVAWCVVCVVIPGAIHLMKKYPLYG